MDALLLAVCVVLAILAIMRLWEYVGPHKDSYSIHNQRRIRASDGLLYNVHEAHSESAKEAAEIMAQLSRFNIAFLRHIRERYVQKEPRSYPGAANVPPPNSALKTRMKNLLDRYNPDVLAESSPFNPRGDTSYTVSKGKKLALCLRRKHEGAPLHDDVHVLQFVTLHELAHIAEDDWGHKKPFWISFKWVLYEAKISGIHEPAFYDADPKMYCGLNVAYQPFHDSALPAIWN